MQGVISGKMDLASRQMQVLQEIRRQLAPYVTCGLPITGATVISDGATIDSLTVVDLMTELEERFDVAIPMNAMANIRTVDDLADTIIRLAHS